MAQLPLPLSFDKRFSLDNFIAPDADYLRRQLRGLFDATGESLIGLCGAADSGKTHLLNACAHYARDCGLPYHLFDAAQLMEATADGFYELPGGSLVGVDNLDLLAGRKAWEQQFYQLINRVKQGELRFIFSLSRPPRDVGFRLPDLKSRLMWGLLITLHSPDEEQLAHILQTRASLLGLDLPQDVVNYLLSHFSRKLSDQMQLLHRLDHAALSQQRRLTVPFIRQNLP
ncbi:MAG: DnaA regulatory inactivator Hda [Gammaproteobacteria bacterium]|nr:DnaA regulatory inactivator Hda [Gammaproteobacteria bacterium]